MFPSDAFNIRPEGIGENSNNSGIDHDTVNNPVTDDPLAALRSAIEVLPWHQQVELLRPVLSDQPAAWRRVLDAIERDIERAQHIEKRVAQWQPLVDRLGAVSDAKRAEDRAHGEAFSAWRTWLRSSGRPLDTAFPNRSPGARSAYTKAIAAGQVPNWDELERLDTQWNAELAQVAVTHVERDAPAGLDPDGDYYRRERKADAKVEPEAKSASKSGSKAKSKTKEKAMTDAQIVEAIEPRKTQSLRQVAEHFRTNGTAISHMGVKKAIDAYVRQQASASEPG